MSKIYKNSTEVGQLHGYPIYMNDVVDACLNGRLNLFLQGDTGSGKTQLARDAMSYFPDESLFVLGRNDMDTRELFQQINLGKLNSKPKYQLEPLVNPDSGEVEFYYSRPNESGVIVPQKLTKEQADRVRKSLETLAGNSGSFREVTSRVNNKICVVDELANCVPAVRAQLFNIFDGFIELGGKAYPFGTHFIATYPDGRVELIEEHKTVADLEKMRSEGVDIRSDNYSVGIATGNIGQQFTESSNDLGRAIRDRMHVIVDTDYYFPSPSDTLQILDGNTNPRVEFTEGGQGNKKNIIEKSKALGRKQTPFPKLITAGYLIHGLDYCKAGGQERSKREMKNSWPNAVDGHGQAADEGLVLPISIRAAKSVIRLSQALDDIVVQKGADPIEVDKGAFESMMQAYRLVSTYSGVLNEARVQSAPHKGNHYAAIDAVISTTRAQFDTNKKNIKAGLEMVRSGKTDKRVIDLFKGRWEFMKDILEYLATQSEQGEK